MVEQTSKRHHAVPRFYLDRFTGADGLLYLHDKHHLSAVKAHPNDAIVEKYLYAPEVGEKPFDDSMEKFLANHVDSPAAPVIEKLSRGGAISEEERACMAVFLAFQDVRGLQARETISNFVGEIGGRILNMSAERPDSIKKVLEKMGEIISDEHAQELADSIKNNYFEVEATKVPWLEAMPVAIDIAEKLNLLPWKIAEAHPDIEFISSDTPIAKILTDPSVPRFGGVGWFSPFAESTFTLDPAHCLIIRQDQREGRVKAPKSWSKDVNRRLIVQARRFVVSRSPDYYIDEIAKKSG